MSLRVFCAVAELRSFSAAGKRLGLSTAMVSKHVIQLEGRLGTRLLNRTSRHVSVTETGTLYFTQTRQMLEGLDDVEAAISNVTILPRGILKLSAPVWVANAFIARVIADYQLRYPDVSVDLDLSGRIVNLADEGFDLALRATVPERLDPGLIARPLMKVRFHLLASPSYLGRVGRPETLTDLNGHLLLRYSGMNLNSTFSVDGPEGRETLKLKTVMQSENETMLHLMALEGAGLVFLPILMAEPDIRGGRLEPVLPNAINPQATLFAVYTSKKHLSAKVRTFIDFLASRTSSDENLLIRPQ